MLQYPPDLIKYNFITYLTSLGLSEKSHKNYRSDLSHFIGWVLLKAKSLGSYIESLTEAVPFLSHDISKEYKSFMFENKIPVKTINRRLSTLRHLSHFLLTSSTLDFDFMEGIENVSLNQKKNYSGWEIIQEFRSYLETEKVSKNTVKNYVSDIHQFLEWLEVNQGILNS